MEGHKVNSNNERSNLIRNEVSPRSSHSSQTMTPGDALESCLGTIGIGKFHYIFMIAVGLVFAAEAQQIFLTTFIRHKVESEFSVNNTDAATMATAFFAGVGVGALVFGFAADVVGRRLVSIVSLIMAAVFGICAAVSVNFVMLEFSLLFTGFAVGGGFVMVALFMELLPATSRETWCSVAYSMWTWGTLVQCLWAYLLDQESWRWLTAMTTLPLILTMFFCLKFPESPRYLLSQKDYNGAHALVHRLATANGVPVPVEAQFILQPRDDAEPNSEVKESPLAKLRQIFYPNVRRLTLSMWLVWGGVAASYYGIIMLTTSVFLKGAGGGGSGDGYLAVAISACGELPCYPLIRVCTKKMGRRLPLIVFPLITAVLLILFYFIMQPDSEATFDNWKFVAELAIVFVIRLFTLLAFDIAYMFSPEAFPTAIRTTGTGSCSAMARVTSMLTPFVAYPLKKADPVAPYIVFAALLVLVAVGGYLVPFDTKGKTMDEKLPTSEEAKAPSSTASASSVEIM